MTNFRSNRLLLNLPPEVIAKIEPMLHELEFLPGDVIFQENDPGDFLYLIGEGTVLISKLGRLGQHEPLSYLTAGDFFGEMALLDFQPRSARAMAVEKVVVGRIDRKSLQELLDLAPAGLPSNFLATAVERLRRVDTHFIEELMRSERLSAIGSTANAILHNMRTPMSAITASCDLITQKTRDPEITRMVANVRRAVDRMNEMAFEISDFARGTPSLQIERVPVARVIEELDQQSLSMLPSNIRVEKDVRCDGELKIDLNRFVRVLADIVKNAQEAMPSGGTLRIVVERGDNNVLFILSDTGWGMPRNILARVFDAFVTFGKPKSAGLGLAIVRSVVEAHGGRILAESTEGQGATFTVELPVAE